MHTFIVTTLLIFSSLVSAKTPLTTDPNLQLDLNYCSSIAKNYAIGDLRSMNLTPHYVKAEVFAFSEDIYYVTVTTEIINEALIEKGPEFAYNCFRCPNLEMVVAQKSYTEACTGKR